MCLAEEMDGLCSDKTGTLTLNKLTVNKNMIEDFVDGVDKDMVVSMAARASRLKNQDSTDAAIVAMLGDPKEARAEITKIRFLPFNPTDERTTLTCIDKAGKMHRMCKGAPEQVCELLLLFSETILRRPVILRRVTLKTMEHGNEDRTGDSEILLFNFSF